MTLDLLAPAKLNLFLHIVGRRPNGYHELQSVFILIDLCDTVKLTLREDGKIVRTGDVIGDIDKDLCVKAARLLQSHFPTSLGVEIDVIKRIPAGAGLGGGSSDAATTLMGLNKLWNLHLSEEQLMPLAAGLGADVPFFLYGPPALLGTTTSLTAMRPAMSMSCAFMRLPVRRLRARTSLSPQT